MYVPCKLIRKVSHKDTSKFFRLLNERLEMGVRALDIKYRNLCQREQGLMPFQTNLDSKNQYIQLENGFRLINFAGLRESVEGFHSGKPLYQTDKVFDFFKEILSFIEEYVGKKDEKSRSQILPAMLPDMAPSRR